MVSYLPSMKGFCIVLLVLAVSLEGKQVHVPQEHKYDEAFQDDQPVVTRVNKDGACPEVSTDTVGVCMEGCSGDSDCEGKLKCCSNGCGKQCLEAVEEKQCAIPCPKIYDPVCGTDAVTYSTACMLRYLTCTRNQDFIHVREEGECPKRRGPCETAKEEKSMRSKMRMTGQSFPQCDDKGYFRPRQCSGSVGSCWCVTREGEVLDTEDILINSDEDCLAFLMEPK